MSVFFKLHILIQLVLVFQVSFANDSNGNHKATGLLNTIFDVCENKGMLACRPGIQGADFLFEYIELFDQIATLQKTFDSMVKSKFTKEYNGMFEVFNVASNLSLDITFTPSDFISRISNIKKINSGYEVMLDADIKIELKEKNQRWTVIFPNKMSEQFESLKPYYFAGLLIRRILIYRINELRMTNISFEKTEKEISADITAVLISLYGEDKWPSLKTWSVKNLSEVESFYHQFATPSEMKAYIKKSN